MIVKRTWTVRAIDNQSLPPLTVEAATERVALERAGKAIVQWHCQQKGLPYYHYAVGEAWSSTENPDGPPIRGAFLGGYQAYRYIAGGDRDAQGKKVRWGGVPDPEARPLYGGSGHFVPCGGIWILEC